MRIQWTALERRWRDALCAAMIPRADGGALPGVDAIDTSAFWDEVDRAAPELLRFGFRASVWALSLSPLVLIGKPTTFAHLAPADRDRVLGKVAGSRLYLVRQLPLTVKLMACFAYLRDDDVRARVEELAGA